MRDVSRKDMACTESTVKQGERFRSLSVKLQTFQKVVMARLPFLTTPHHILIAVKFNIALKTDILAAVGLQRVFELGKPFYFFPFSLEHLALRDCYTCSDAVALKCIQIAVCTGRF